MNPIHSKSLVLFFVDFILNSVIFPCTFNNKLLNKSSGNGVARNRNVDTTPSYFNIFNSFHHR